MIEQVTQQIQIPALTVACGFEHVFGSKVLTATKAYGLSDPRASFWLQTKEGVPTAALYGNNGVLVVSGVLAGCSSSIKGSGWHRVKMSWLSLR